MSVVVGRTELPLERVRRGKVRDVYAVAAGGPLVVASGRGAALGGVMNGLGPHKGAVLTQITAWWLRQFEGELAHHMLSADTGEIVKEVPVLAPHRAVLEGRTM